MQLSAPLLLLLAASAQAFTGEVMPQTLKTTALQMTSSAASATTSFEKPPRVIRDDLPILYVYDHCPFCVRVRVALGIKNIKHNLHFLANDDIPTPTALVGKKIAPIFVSYYVLAGFYLFVFIYRTSVVYTVSFFNMNMEVIKRA